MNVNVKYYQLLQQISDGNPFKKTVAAPVFDVASDFQKDMEVLAANRNFSPEGRRNEAQKHLRRALRDLRDIQKPLDQHHAETETMAAAVKRPIYDKSDIVGAMNRQEFRAASRAMSPGQRAGYLTGPHRSAAYRDAVMEFANDPWMSGVNVFEKGELDTFEIAKEEHLRDLHGPLQDTIAERKTNVSDIRDLAVAVVRNDLQHHSQLESRDFEDAAKRIETRADEPWVTSDRTQVVEIQPDGSANYRSATKEEAEKGRIFSPQAFEAARSA